MCEKCETLEEYNKLVEQYEAISEEYCKPKKVDEMMRYRY